MADANLHAEKVAELATPVEKIEIVEEGAPEGDKRLNARDEDEDDDGAPEGATEEEREALREKRREERRQRRERQNKARERDKSYQLSLERQNKILEERLAALEGRTHQQDAREIDARLSQTQQELLQAERALKDAVARGDGELLTKALRVRDDATMRARQLQDVRQRIQSAPQGVSGVDPTVARNAQQWAEDHPWYDLNGRDQDSAIVATIDAKLAEEGLDPRSDDYWDELSDRVEKALPHKFKARGKRTSPPVSGGREHASGATTFVVSKERKQAMVDAGIWDDPVRREKAVRAYRDFDKQNATR